MTRRKIDSAFCEALKKVIFHHDEELCTAEHVLLNSAFAANNYKPLEVVLESGKGVWVTAIDGKRYMDFLSAYSSVNQGHCHPDIVKAVNEQGARLGNVSRAFLHNRQGPASVRLAQYCGKDKVLFMNSGAEAVETAIKAARMWGFKKKGITKPEIITFAGNFHGRTITIISFSTEPLYRDGFGAFTPGFPKAVEYGDIDAVCELINENTVGILLEPIQGEAGVIIPPDSFLREVREVCSSKRILMMADEIQTGFGRTGKRFACDHEKVEPDIYIVGKALGGGQEVVSAVVANSAILDVFTPGSHGSTFGAFPKACAAVIASLDVIEKEKLAERSAELGAYFMKRLQSIKPKRRLIKEIRGKGLFIGLELYEKARPYCERLMQEGMLCKETHENTIRFAPPLVITKEELDWAFERVKKVLEA